MPCLSTATNTIESPVIGFAHSPPEAQQPIYMRWERWRSYMANASLEGLTFVQIGANCGLNTNKCALGGDPIWTYATQCGWRGVAVEPIKDLARQLHQNYAHLPGVTPLHAAISNRSGTAMMASKRESSRMIISGKAPGRTESTTMLSVSDLWRTAVLARGWARVDMLVVDVEGHEPIILRATLPRPKPALILYEFCHTKVWDQEAIDANLGRQGYHWLADVAHQTGPPVDRLYGRLHAAGGAAGGKSQAAPGGTIGTTVERRPHFYWPYEKSCTHGYDGARAKYAEGCHAFLRGVAAQGRKGRLVGRVSKSVTQ